MSTLPNGFDTWLEFYDYLIKHGQITAKSAGLIAFGGHGFDSLNIKSKAMTEIQENRLTEEEYDQLLATFNQFGGGNLQIAKSLEKLEKIYIRV